MKRTPFFLFALVGLLIAQEPAPQEQIARAILPDEDPAEAVSDAPVRVPPMKHYAKLWSNSMFTTRAMALPAASGPIFTDNLSLSGTFEDNGKLTAILIDRTTSNIVQAYIGEDNAEGFRISKIEPGPTPDKMRLQLQKGNQVGWLGFSEAVAPSAPAAPTNALATQAPVVAPVGVQVPNPLLPPLTSSVPQPAMNGDPPLPPQ